jgi:FtsP/CotA-like multicopper oxidase with cupredoxin domain
MPLNRREVLQSTAAAAGAFVLPNSESCAELGRSNALPILPLIDARERANGIALEAVGTPGVTRGFNGPSLGPVLRLHRGDEVEIAVTNAMPDFTAVHWHGLLIPAGRWATA